MSASNVDGQRAARRSNRSIRLAALSAALCVGSLSAAVLANDAAQVPRTGQTKTYGPRDDGALRKGVVWPAPRFVPTVDRVDDTGIGGGVADNGICDGTEPCDGAVLDRLTGLIWLQNADCFGEKGWNDALASANQLASGQCGLSDGSTQGDWRLPNMNELKSLLDFGCVNPAVSDGQGTGCYATDPDPVFSNVQTGLYWSSSIYAYFPVLARLISFRDGFTSSFGKASPLFVWPVRSQSAAVLASDAAQVPRTGQTKTYGPRDDGTLRTGAVWPIPRFVRTVSHVDDTGIGQGGVADNGICDGAEPCDGAVLDRLTGLTWLQNADCFGKRGWNDALGSANQLASGQCGLSDGSTQGDWRLPSINELWSLANFACANPALSNGQGTGCFAADPKPVFSNVPSCAPTAVSAVCLPEYWSSTVHAGYPARAWLLYLFDGGLGYGTRGSFSFVWPLQASVWPVRGGE